MSQEPDVESAESRTQTEADAEIEADADAASREKLGGLYALEICFLTIIGVVVALAFVEALSYELVSSRTPFVIMAPLFVLIVIHACRLWRVRAEFDVGARLRAAFSGRAREFNKVVGISAWMAALVLMVWALGHYAGIFLFCVILMRLLRRERWVLTLGVAVVTTLIVFGLFEYVFNIELYRGLVVRYFLGFRDF